MQEKEKIHCVQCLKEIPLILTRNAKTRVRTCSESCEDFRQKNNPIFPGNIEERKIRANVSNYHRKEKERLLGLKDNNPEEPNHSEEAFTWDEPNYGGY